MTASEIMPFKPRLWLCGGFLGSFGVDVAAQPIGVSRILKWKGFKGIF